MNISASKVGGLDEIPHIEYTLDKFLKLADNITREIADGGDYKKEGSDHIISITQYLFDHELLHELERNSMFDGSLEIPEIVFLLLEILIFGYYFTEYEPDATDTSSNSLSYIYAWDIYIRLAEDLGKTTKEYPFGEKKPLLLEDKRGEVKKEIDTILHEKYENLKGWVDGIYNIIGSKSYLDEDHYVEDFLNFLLGENIIGPADITSFYMLIVEFDHDIAQQIIIYEEYLHEYLYKILTNKFFDTDKNMISRLGRLLILYYSKNSKRVSDIIEYCAFQGVRFTLG